MISLDLLLDTLESAANAAARPTDTVSVKAEELLRVVGEVARLKEQLAAKERECGELRRLCGGTRPVSLDKDQIAPTPKGD